MDGADWRVTISCADQLQAARIVREVLAGHHFQAELAIDRWHLVQQAWEDPDVPMPRSDAERRADTNG